MCWPMENWQKDDKVKRLYKDATLAWIPGLPDDCSVKCNEMRLG